MAANSEIVAGSSSPEAGAERVWWANEMMMVDDSKEGGFKKAEFKFDFVETRRMSRSDLRTHSLLRNQSHDHFSLSNIRGEEQQHPTSVTN